MIGKKMPHRPGGNDGPTQLARRVTQLYAPAYEKVSPQLWARGQWSTSPQVAIDVDGETA
jgi:hypothetical protein